MAFCTAFHFTVRRTWMDIIYTIICTIICTITCTVTCTTTCTIMYTIICTVTCTSTCTIIYTIICSTTCTIDALTSRAVVLSQQQNATQQQSALEPVVLQKQGHTEQRLFQIEQRFNIPRPHKALRIRSEDHASCLLGLPLHRSRQIKKSWSVGM
jgi:hypothetical protein